MNTTALKLAFRNIRKNLLSSSINIVGFAIGITCVVVIGLWIQQERSFDGFHTHYNYLYRITMHDVNGKEDPTAYVPTTFAKAFSEEIPEIKSYVNFYQHNESVFKKGEISFFESSGLYTDNTVFDLFDFPLINGNKENALSNPFSLALSEKLAHKYFGKENPIGENITIDNQDYTVTAIYKDIPSNSHIQADYLLSIATIAQIWSGYYDWNSNRVNAYVLVDETADIASVNNKMKQIISSHTSLWEDIGFEYSLQPFRDVYLEYQYQPADRFKFGDMRNLYIFTFVGMAILLISCLNYINLFKAQNLSRRKEIGINKIIGAQRKNIIGLFIAETGVHIFLALSIAIVFISGLYPYLNQLVEISITPQTLFSSTILYLFAAVLLICFFTGVLPAISFSKISPINILNKKPDNKSLIAKNGLVIFQFGLSIMLIACTLVALRQKDYLMNKNLGFDKEHVLIMPVPNDNNYNYETFKERLLQSPNVSYVTIKSGSPRDWFDGGFYCTYGFKLEECPRAERCWIGYDYFETMDIKFVQGRPFSKEFASDERESIILNQKAVDELGLQDPLGKEVFFNDQRRKIVGVTENILTKSLKEKIFPQLYIMRSGGTYGAVIMAKMNGNVNDAMASLQKTWGDYYVGYPFRYEFLDQLYGQLYEREIKLSAMFKVFTFIAILLSALGILGLAFFDSQYRIKEIGVRKVNGAKLSDVLILLNKGFAKLVAIAFVIATPIAYYAMNKWLENFAYKTDLSWWIFALAGVLALGIALLTVSWQSWKAATRNPVEALRYE